MKTKGLPSTATSGKRRVFLVDDHPVLREGIALRINQESDLMVCAQARNIRETLRGLAQSKPDLVVVDLSLPDGHGLGLIKDIKVQFPSLPVLVFTMHDESTYAERALRAGARGYITKQQAPEEVLVAIRTVLRGGYFVSEHALSGFLHNVFTKRGSDAATSVGHLSDRELEVFQLIGQGLGTREIAARLTRSVKTIETHRARIKEKFRLKSANELVCRASRWVQAGQ